MKNKFKLMILMFASIMLQQSQAQKFFIRFTDKNNSLYSVSNPSAFLSQRAIDRRLNHGIPITTQDLPVNQTYIDGITTNSGQVFAVSKWFNGVVVQCDSVTLSYLLTLPYVMNAEKITKTVRNPRDTKFDTGIPFAKRTALRTSVYDYGFGYNQIHLMNGEYLHNIGYKGEGMVMAILDAGFYNVDQLTAFDSLRNRNGILGTWDFVENNSSVYEDDTHGMEVLSTIVGNVPGELIGTAPEANVWLLRTEDVFSENIIEEYNWAAAAEFADSVGADVISSSLGYTDFDDTLASHTYADMDGHTCPSSVAANIAFSKGILVSVSAGNSGNNSWHYISAPSDGDSVISVGAVDPSGLYVSFSSYGPASDGDIKPNVASQGANSTVADPFGGFGGANGTSFSCPIFAGAATCLIQAHPTKSVLEIKTAIEKSANYYQTPTDTLGYGIPNFANADFLLSGIDGRTEPTPFAIYPNPVRDQLHIRLFTNSNENVRIVIYDYLGKTITVSTKNVYGGAYQVIDIPSVAELTKGIYFVHVEMGGKSFVGKIIKL